MLALYQTQNLNGYLDETFYDFSPYIGKQKTDPFYTWYADIFFLNRKKQIVLTNALTKFTFHIFNYSKSQFPRFETAFGFYFYFALGMYDLDPGPYMDSADGFVLTSRINRSALAHLSWLKRQHVPLVKNGTYDLANAKDQANYNYFVNYRTAKIPGNSKESHIMDTWILELEKRDLT